MTDPTNEQTGQPTETSTNLEWTDTEWTDTGWTDWDMPPSIASPPPPETIAWVEQQLGATVLHAMQLVGGLSSAVHRLDLDSDRSVVLRRHTNAAWMAREPNIPFDEERVLWLLANLDVGVATPTLLAADPDGRHCDVPTLIMTEVAGTPFLRPVVPNRWAERLAKCLADIHRVPIPSGVGHYQRWDHPDSPVPEWIEDHDLWHRAKARVAGPLPQDNQRFLHRDFHPNNIHWDDGEICAVVDWLGACVGPAAGDLAHCRWNLAMLTEPDVAEHFTDHYRSLTGIDHTTLEFDLATVLSAPVGPFPTHAWNSLGRTDLTSETVAAKIQTWLRHLLDG